jgi:excisionase family DNA binding protein
VRSRRNGRPRPTSSRRATTGSDPEPPSQPAEGDLAPDRPTTLLSVPVVARRLGVSDRSIRRYIKRGLLRAYKIGGQIRIAEEDLMAFLASCRLAKSDIPVE